jgi:hypothetical protein
VLGRLFPEHSAARTSPALGARGMARGPSRSGDPEVIVTAAPRFRVRALLERAPAGLPTRGDAALALGSGLSPEARERAVHAAWYWPEAEEVLPALEHAIAIALVAPPEDDLEHAVALTRAAAEVGQAVGARAYAWEAEGLVLVHDALAFTDQASDATPDDLPLYLWIGFEAREAGEGTIAVLTRGMSTFERPEVEVDRSSRELEEVLEVVTDAALYVLTASTALEDGETLEVTRGKVRVRILPSLRNDGTRALRLRLP